MLAPLSIRRPRTLPAPATAVEAVVEALLAEILRGNFPPGTRLPAEREMAKMLGASRPTLREALRRLGEWNLVEPRRGSGIVVRPQREWTIEVRPAFLRHGRPHPRLDQALAAIFGGDSTENQRNQAVKNRKSAGVLREPCSEIRDSGPRDSLRRQKRRRGQLCTLKVVAQEIDQESLKRRA